MSTWGSTEAGQVQLHMWMFENKQKPPAEAEGE
jgi:hypothetical protein